MRGTKQVNELTVLVKAKVLTKYVFEVTQDSPKKFRFSLIGRLQNYTLELERTTRRANGTYIDAKLLRDLDRSIKAASTQLNNEPKPVGRQHLENKLLILRLTKATKFEERIGKRVDLQHEAKNILEEIDHLVSMAKDMYCITAEERSSMAKYITEVRKLLEGWTVADKRRYGY